MQNRKTFIGLLASGPVLAGTTAFAETPASPRVTRVMTMLAVRDLKRSIAFYRDTLGFVIEQEQPWIALLRLGTFLLYVYTEGPPTPDKPGISLVAPRDRQHTSTIICFEVDDVAAMYERLRGKGVRFLTPPTKPPWGGLRCFAFDPDGYLLEIESP